MLLKSIEGSSLLKNDIYDYRRKVFNTGKPDYEALLAMLDRHSVKR